MTETIYINGEPVGVVRRCNKSNQVAFSPNSPPSKLPDRDWDSIDQLKAAVTKAYRVGGDVKNA